MKLQQLLDLLNELSPFELQDSWDNSGLILGDLEQEIGNVYLSLDIEEAMLEDLEEGSALIVHHPLIFKGLKQIDFAKYPSNIVRKAIKKDISIIAMHTNYDQTHLNRYVLENVLGYSVEEVDGYLAYFQVNKPFRLFAEEVAQKLGLDPVRVVEGTAHINSAALCTGAGASLIGELKADCLLTGDIKYHEALAAKEEKKALIDIGHFESERYFAASLQKELQNKGINGIIANSKNPFRYIKKG